MTTRRDYLESLLRCDRPVREIMPGLKQFGWDSDEELVTLTPSHIRAVIVRFLKANLQASEVEDWANSIEGRDDIGLETGNEKLLTNAIFRLANPTLNGELTPDSAAVILAQLPE